MKSSTFTLSSNLDTVTETTEDLMPGSKGKFEGAILEVNLDEYKNDKGSHTTKAANAIIPDKDQLGFDQVATEQTKNIRPGSSSGLNVISSVSGPSPLSANKAPK